MSLLIDKLLFLLICASFYLQSEAGDLLVVPVVAAILISALGSLTDSHRIRLILSLFFIIASMFISGFLLFLPLICLDLFAARYPWAVIACMVPLLYYRQQLPVSTLFQIILLILLAWLVFQRSQTMQSWRDQARTLRDQNQEASMRMQEKQQMLLERQDYEINLARLTERNRIAREIHDNLGHQLSRAMIQLGALLVVCKQEDEKVQLQRVKETLSDGMDSIRNSIHDLHDQSIALEMEMRKIIDSFAFCAIVFEYDILTEPPVQHRYALIAIVREALSNVIKHSQADKVSITLREHPGFYQLVIEDNGRSPGSATSLDAAAGIGLRSMQERVRALDGQIHFSRDRGFRIFVSLPRGLTQSDEKERGS